jgi:hypothetical protein
MKTSLFATLAAIVLTATSAFAAPTSMQQGLEGPADYRGRNDCQPYDHGPTTASPPAVPPTATTATRQVLLARLTAMTSAPTIAPASAPSSRSHRDSAIAYVC